MVGLVANRKRKLLKAILFFFFLMFITILCKHLLREFQKEFEKFLLFSSGLVPPLEITHAPQVRSQCFRMKHDTSRDMQSSVT